MTIDEQPRVLHALPGRMRAHVPRWPAAPEWAIEAWLRETRGVRSVRAHALTQNVLIQFDPLVTGERELLDALARMHEVEAREPAARGAAPRRAWGRQVAVTGPMGLLVVLAGRSAVKYGGTAAWWLARRTARRYVARRLVRTVPALGLATRVLPGRRRTRVAVRPLLGRRGARVR